MDENFIPTNWEKKGRIITVVGVGGGGGNAVNYMHSAGVENVDFVLCNTDAQALKDSPVPNKVQLGKMLTKGLGAGMDHIKGRQAAEESSDEIAKLFGPNVEMVFVTCGMGGGTGTGAAPVIASLAKDAGKLTVGVVTIPFPDEGDEAMYRAVEGIKELSNHVDSLLMIDNKKLYELFGTMDIFKGFHKADEVLCTAVKSIADVINKHGKINADFADVRKVMANSGVALMGIGSGSGANRISDAVKEAMESPLLNNLNLATAKNAIVNITTSGEEGKALLMEELAAIMTQIHEYTGSDLDIKRGVVEDNSMGDRINITVIITGFEMSKLPTIAAQRKNVIEVSYMEDLGPSRKYGTPLTPENAQLIMHKARIEGKPSLITESQEELLQLYDEPAFERRERLINSQNQEN